MRFDDWRVEQLGAVTSTQDAVRQRLEAGENVHGLVLRAESQSKGRGRFERPWQSDIGGSYQTVAVADPEGTLRSARVPIAVAVGIAEALRAEDVSIGLKWPNDLYLPQQAARQPSQQTARQPPQQAARQTVDRTARQTAGRTTASGLQGKLGGILCEHVRSHLLIGVGVNVRNPVELPAAALHWLHAETVSRFVLSGITAGLGRLLQNERLPEIYDRYDLLRGREVQVREGERELVGKGAGIDDQGCLILQREETRVSTCSGRIARVGIGIDAAAGG